MTGEVLLGASGEESVQDVRLAVIGNDIVQRSLIIEIFRVNVRLLKCDSRNQRGRENSHSTQAYYSNETSQKFHIHA